MHASMRIFRRLFPVFLILAAYCSVWAVPAQRNMTDSRLAEVQLTSKLDLKAIVDAGGIIDNVTGNVARVYLLETDADQLRARGFSVIWIRDEAKEYGRELWERTGRGRNPLDEYHTNDEIQTLFAGWQTAYPNNFHYESIGLSGQARNLWVCKISDNVADDEAEIEVKYVANMHGDEVVGKENCLRFIEELLTGYGTDTSLAYLMNNYEIWLLPCMNPDGLANVSRYNANGVDLNRNFPDRSDDSVNTTAGREIETALVMNWTAAHNFILSANFHGGALVTNYPWDNSATVPDGSYAPSPEDTMFIWISRRYCEGNPRMRVNTAFLYPDTGITNGSDWYQLSGGMQDWNYVWMGDREVTIELDNTKWPAASRLESLWQENRLAMRNYFLEARYGVRGIVTDSLTGNPVHANISVGWYTYYTFSSALHGEYYRILRPGTYTLIFSAPGYASRTINNVMVSAGSYTTLNVALASVPNPDIAADPSPIVEDLYVCDQRDVTFTILNNGEAALNWSAEEAYTNFGGYGSATGAGWRFINSLQSGGPVYQWKDISTIGTAVSFTTDDQNLGPFNIGFTFPYYGTNFTTFRLSANGWLSFTSTSSAANSYNNVSLPSGGAPENMIAPWWDDLSPNVSGSVRRWTNNTDSLVISFAGVPSFSGGGVYNFELILLSSGKIFFEYGNMGTLRLNSATIGLQNSTGARGLTVIANQLYIQNNMAIALCPNSMIELIPASGSVPAFDEQMVTARLRSCCVPNGTSTGTLAISSNDPDTPVLNVTVSLNVTIAPPDPVADLVIIPEGDGVRLMWSAANLATGYKVYRMTDAQQDYSAGELLTVDPITETEYLDAAPPADSTKFFYQVVSVR